MTAKVLVVDGSEADRATLASLLADTGCELDQAPDGIEAFESVLAQSYDLMVIEAKLERLDAPDLITKLRAHGVKTPILVLSAVTKAATLGALHRLGIVGYVHKASPPDAVRQKIMALLPTATAPAHATSAAPEPLAASEPSATGGKILQVDAVELEHQRLRPLVPASVTLDACKTFNEGLARARKDQYRMLLLDSDASVLNLGGIVAQTHVLQPDAAIVAVATLSKHDERNAVRASLEAMGFDDVMFKPFAAADVSAMVQWYCSTWEDLVSVKDDLIVVSRMRCRKDQRERYVHELTTRLEASFGPLSNACYDRAILDLTRVDQISSAEAAELLARLERAAGALGVTLLVAVAPAVGAGLREFKESFHGEDFRWFPSAAAARASRG